MTTAEFLKKQSEMSDEELINLAEKHVFTLMRNHGRRIEMNVPAKVTDMDMILFEVIKRFKEASYDPRWRDPEIEQPGTGTPDVRNFNMDAAKANAQLIAAAPDLLKALTQLVEINEQRLDGAASCSLAKVWFKKTWKATKRAEKAINKALGI